MFTSIETCLARSRPRLDDCSEYPIMPFQCARGAWSKNEEPSVDELLAEPAIRLVMARDGVKEAEVRRIVSELRNRRASRVATRFHRSS